MLFIYESVRAPRARLRTAVNRRILPLVAGPSVAGEPPLQPHAWPRGRVFKSPFKLHASEDSRIIQQPVLLFVI